MNIALKFLMHCVWGLMYAVMLPAAHAQQKVMQIEDSRELAMSVAIADVHMHAVDRSVEFHKAQMDRNRVQWGGGVGPAGRNADAAALRTALGSRYFYALGQEAFSAVFGSAGEPGLVDPEHPAFVALFATADEMLRTRQAYGFGELHIDNSRTYSSPQFARKVPFDNPVVRRIYEIANRHGAVIQFHMEADEQEIAELKSYLLEFPNSKTLLSHGLGYSRQPLLRRLLSEHPNLYLELSRKGAVLNHKVAGQAFTAEDGPKHFWLKTIEQFPDRFMIGSDSHYPDEEKYDEVMREFRTGLFPYLQPATLRKVAHENAVRVFGLQGQ